MGSAVHVLQTFISGPVQGLAKRLPWLREYEVNKYIHIIFAGRNTKILRWLSKIGSWQEFKARESLSYSVCGDFFESFLCWDNIMYIMYTHT